MRREERSRPHQPTPKDALSKRCAGPFYEDASNENGPIQCTKASPASPDFAVDLVMMDQPDITHAELDALERLLGDELPKIMNTASRTGASGD